MVRCEQIVSLVMSCYLNIVTGHTYGCISRLPVSEPLFVAGGGGLSH